MCRRTSKSPCNDLKKRKKEKSQVEMNNFLIHRKCTETLTRRQANTDDD